jgi:hypothetical protein
MTMFDHRFFSRGATTRLAVFVTVILAATEVAAAPPTLTLTSSRSIV